MTMMVSFRYQLAITKTHLPRESQLRNHLNWVCFCLCEWGIVLIVNWCRKTQPVVGGTMSQAGVQNYVGQETVGWSRQLAWSIHFFLLFSVDVAALGFCFDFPSIMDNAWNLSWINFFFSKLLFVIRVSCHNSRNETRVSSHGHISKH